MKSFVLIAVVLLAGFSGAVANAAPPNDGVRTRSALVSQRSAADCGIRRFAERHLDESQVDAFVDFAQSALDGVGWDVSVNEDPGRPLLRMLLFLAILTGALP